MSKPQKYRKKPVEIEAMRWDGDNAEDIQVWMGLGFHPVAPADRAKNPESTAELFVNANSRWLGIETGEWVIRDSRGFYPCKPDIFEATYEEVTT